MCRELRGNLIEVYWLLLIPLTVFSICLEFFKFPDGNPAPGKFIKRVVVSLLLLYSFDECLNIIATLSDGVTEKIGGIARLKDLLKHMESTYERGEVSWVRFREAILYIVSLISYLVAYLGVFVADLLTHFVWSILYVASPLMILMYVHEKTAFVTSSLYRGLINVVIWKIVWSILAVLLIKMATSPEVARDSDNFVTVVLMNLCIGLGMLFVPFVTKSLLTNGLESAASTLAAAPAAATLGAIKLYAAKTGKASLAFGADGVRGFPRLREWARERGERKLEKNHPGGERETADAQSRSKGSARAQGQARDFGKKPPPKNKN